MMNEHQCPFSESALHWIREASQLVGSLTVALCPGGRSNLTYRIQDETGESIILRRPPAGMVLPTAHDMGREFRFLSALAPTGFAVPRPVAFCDDPALIGAPFYLMEEAQGLILRDDEQASAVPIATRQVIGPNLITTLSQLHSFDPATIGLPATANPHAYVGRQLDRWLTQVSSVVTFEADLIATVLEVGHELRAHMPETEAIGIVHGDYRLDNVVLTDHGEVVAVLDWEIASIGDPLADIGMLGVYWMDANDDRMRGINSATRLEGFTSRAELYELYAQVRHIDPERITFYQHFGSWKLACILIGVVERYRSGASGGDQSSIDDYPTLITELLAAATLAH
jgi:aminoglycoside phosphotransferase (APT) family kinase protein